MAANDHVKNYLNYYIGKKIPGYAVMLNGAWGIGKTFLLKKFIEDIKSKNGNFKCVYVSLYGVSSLEDVDYEIFKALYPFIDGGVAKVAGHTLKAVTKYLKIDTGLKLGDVLEKSTADLYIFDDLERGAISVNSLLGYINSFVEHDGKNVVVVANEAEIKDKLEYEKIREKLIGKTIEIQESFGDALGVFVESIESDFLKVFLLAKSTEIYDIYRYSELKNLRILQQSLWDFERLYEVLTDLHKANDSAMSDLLKILMALSFEFKAGRLGETDFKRRMNALVASHFPSKAVEVAPKIVQSQRRYKNVDLTSNILSDDTLINILVKGLIEAETIRRELDSSSYFVRVGDEPEWRTVWYLFERGESEFTSALLKMEDKFAKTEYIILGEILQVFGLRIWLSRIGIIEKTLDSIVLECEKYIDKLYLKKLLEPIFDEDGVSDFMLSGYGGLELHEASSVEFSSVMKNLLEKRRLAGRDKHKDFSKDLLLAMKSNSEDFFRLLNGSGGFGELSRIPVMASMDKNQFADAFFELNPIDQRSVLIAMKARYSSGSLDASFQSERSFVRDVYDVLHARAGALSKISCFRIQSLLRSCLGKTLGE